MHVRQNIIEELHNLEKGMRIYAKQNAYLKV